MSVSSYLSTSAGFRGISRCLGIFSAHAVGGIEQMSYSTLRHWVLSLGYGLLNQPIAQGRDWIYILDYSIQLGCDRCLVILGVRGQSLLDHGYELSHDQMSVLDIYISSTSNAQVVYQRLLVAAQRTGVPDAVLSDQGADIRKGIELFTQDHPALICSSDITHKIGCLLKKYLPVDPRWEQLEKDLTSLTQRIKQSKLSFLRPLTLRKKSKWLNIEQLFLWLTHLFEYRQRGDFSLIGKGFKIANPDHIVTQLYEELPDKRKARTLKKQLTQLLVQSPEDLHQQLKSPLPPAVAQQIEWIPYATQQFEEKFQPIFQHQAFAQELAQLYQVLTQIKAIIKSEGLSLDTLEQIAPIGAQITYPWIRKLYLDLNNFLVEEHAKARPDSKPLLICSDVIESIFGKFKAKAKQSVGGIYQTVLIIPLFCEKLSHQKIKDILENVSIEQVNQWIENIRGPSNLAKRRKAFSFD